MIYPPGLLINNLARESTAPLLCAMFRNHLTLGGGLSLLAFVSMSAAADQILLSSGSVIGGSPIYDSASFSGPDYSALNVVDAQTGAIGAEIQGFGYWITPNAVTGSSAYFVIDLGAQYFLSEVELFNTHNGYFHDRGTNGFVIEAANAVMFVDANRGYNFVNGATILTGSLPIETESAPSANSFTSSNGLDTEGAAYRYLRFTTVSYYISGGGLNEIRVFGAAAVPEPAAAGAMAGAVALSCVIGGRRRAIRRARGE